jgi:hypothetical protein
MSKKTNNTTLREIKFEKNLFYKDFHNYLHFYKFVKNIENLMYIKNIVLNVNNLNSNLNSLHFNSNIYLNTKKIYFYKKVSKKLFFQNKNSKSNLINLFTNLTLKFRLKQIYFNLHFVNKFLNNKIIIIFLKKFSKFFNSLFRKKLNFFFDLIKITILFILKKLTINNYLLTLIKIFQFIPKKKHNTFFNFLQLFFHDMVFNMNQIFSYYKYTNFYKVEGIKFQIYGKLKGKTRASKKSIRIGKISLQTLNKSIFFTQLPAFTNSGVFGFNLWINVTN